MKHERNVPQAIELVKLGMKSRQAKYIGDELYTLNHKIEVIDGDVKALHREMNRQFLKVNERFNKIDERFDSLETEMNEKFELVLNELKEIKEKL